MEFQASTFVGGSGFSAQGVSMYSGSWGELHIREVTPEDQDLGSSGFSSVLQPVLCCPQVIN